MRLIALFTTIGVLFSAPGCERDAGQDVSDRHRLPLSDYYSRPRSAGAVDTVMIHFCSNVVADRRNPHRIEPVIEMFRSVGLSAHYLIDRDGRIFQLVAENRVAYHAGRGVLAWRRELENNLNEHSIGIEILAIGSEREMSQFVSPNLYQEIAASDIGFTKMQYSALRALLQGIRNRHPGVALNRRSIVGHEDYAPGRKVDPGELFDWTEIGLSR